MKVFGIYRFQTLDKTEFLALISQHLEEEGKGGFQTGLL